jgi:pyruvate,orthophosphate dikinase
VVNALKGVEKMVEHSFGNPENPLLVSVRSGARASMPGMMDTILNLGLNDETVEGLAKKTGNPRFAWDAYRRFISMYGCIVLHMKPHGKEDHPFEAILERVKEEHHYKQDTELTVEDLKLIVAEFKHAVLERTKKDFPQDVWEQLWGAIWAVFESWNNERAILYRKLHKIPDEWGTAVSVVSMVFGNMGNTSGTGVGFTRDASTGENLFNGEYLINA